MSNITTNHAITYTNSTLECLYVRKAVWFADNATGAGSLGELKKWWGVLNESEPSLGYFPNAKKSRIIVEPEKEEAARDLFGQTINQHLHSGSQAFRSSTRLKILYLGVYMEVKRRMIRLARW